MSIIVRSDRRPRSFLEVVPPRRRARFDWLSPDEATGFFRYRGEVYHLSTFERFSDPYWHGVYCTSATTGVLVRVEPEERIIVGTYRS